MDTMQDKMAMINNKAGREYLMSCSKEELCRYVIKYMNEAAGYCTEAEKLKHETRLWKDIAKSFQEIANQYQK